MQPLDAKAYGAGIGVPDSATMLGDVPGSGPAGAVSDVAKQDAVVHGPVS